MKKIDGLDQSGECDNGWVIRKFVKERWSKDRWIMIEINYQALGSTDGFADRVPP